MVEWTENTPVTAFDDPGGGEIIVFRVCPECGRFIKTGELFTDSEGENIKFVGWTCSKHGEVKPDWTRS